MALNFANENLAKISSDQVCSDYHDVQNLISSNETNRQKGFLVEYYIRPPISIVIEFKHNIDLMYLELGLQLRQHRSKGIEVYTNSSSSSTSQLVAKCFNPRQDKLTIVNGGYKPNRHLPQINATMSQDSFYVAGRNFKFCNNISSLQIRIISTFDSTVPCLSRLDIYGKPSGLHGDNLRNFCASLNDKKAEQHMSNENHIQNERTKSIRDLSQQIEHLAPVEFFDAITQELMKNPYILPSGKNIDKTTLNKYLATKNDYTPPSDPFTRVPFTEQQKPVLNVELKARIDLFYSTNGQSEIDRRNELRKRLLNLP